MTIPMLLAFSTTTLITGLVAIGVVVLFVIGALWVLSQGGP